MSSVQIDRLDELIRIANRTDDVLSGSVPKNIRDGQVLHVKKRISKTIGFVDTPIDVQNFNLVIISTAGDLATVSYKIRNLENKTDDIGIEATDEPTVIGYNRTLFISSGTGEAGKNVEIDMYLAPPALLASLAVGSQEVRNRNFNGIEWTNNRQHWHNSIHESGAESASITGTAFDVFNCQTCFVWFKITASTGTHPTGLCRIRFVDDTSGTALAVLSTAAIATNVLTSMVVGQGVDDTETTIDKHNDIPLVKDIRIDFEIGGTDAPTITYTIGADIGP